MTPKERMLTAIGGGKPDRLPVTIHQWQRFHLERHMNGMSQLEAFKETGLDASITPRGILKLRETDRWRVSREDVTPSGGQPRTRIRIETPDGKLTAGEARGDGTVYVTEHLLKDAADAERFLKHWPGMELDKAALSACYDETGDAGIVRGNVEAAHQPGVWQDFCELVGTDGESDLLGYRRARLRARLPRAGHAEARRVRPRAGARREVRPDRARRRSGQFERDQPVDVR